MNDEIFKKELKEQFSKHFGDMKKVRYAFLELDIQKPKERIEYPGYNEYAQRVGEYNPQIIPGFRSPVKVVLFINERNGVQYKNKDYSYEGDIFLLVANSVLSEGFVNKSGKDKIEELAEYAEYTIKQLNTWGLFPVYYEAIPEIHGCVPEQIYPHSKQYLTKILDKIARNEINGFAEML